jgi:translation initiation factor 5B
MKNINNNKYNYILKQNKDKKNCLKEEKKPGRKALVISFIKEQQEKNRIEEEKNRIEEEKIRIEEEKIRIEEEKIRIEEERKHQEQKKIKPIIISQKEKNLYNKNNEYNKMKKIIYENKKPKKQINKKDENNNKKNENEYENIKSTNLIQKNLQTNNTLVSSNCQKKLRSPICCILGHVDTGKTKLLDKIRKTNIQEEEAGGITQQIGATFFPLEKIKDQTIKVSEKTTLNLKVPGLLIIDTPGHESFTNLRMRGTSLCDIAILVVDIMHGLEPQTLESIRLLKERKTPFIVALNKIDRLYGWKSSQMSSIRDVLQLQNNDVIQKFTNRVQETIILFAEQGLNAELYYKNKDLRKTISIVPTSAISGDGIPDMLLLLMQLTQTFMTERLVYISELQCTVLEVKVVDGLGTTIDVILVNGILHEGDEFVINGLNGPIVSNIRALLTPEPMKELRIKSSYIHHKELQASIGCKICAPGLENAIVGSELIVIKKDDDIEDIKKELNNDIQDIYTKYKEKHGVFVQTSTLGSLEALLQFLNNNSIPVSGINIGPIHKKDVIRASVMLEHEPKYAVILAFDVEVVSDAKELANSLGIRIFTADIIYHLFDKFISYINDLKIKQRAIAEADVIFPVVMKIVPKCVFYKKDPVIMGVEILEGILKIGTPIVVKRSNHKYGDEMNELGTVIGIEINNKTHTIAKKGTIVSVKIQSRINTPKLTYGRHFNEDDFYISKLTRKSIDLLKDNFREDLDKEDWELIKRLKIDLGII